MKYIRFLVSFLLFFGLAGILNAQDLKYRPINPAFGGDSYNYTWLLSQAQVQNDFVEDPNADLFINDPLLDFQGDLNRQVLSQLSRQLVGDLFGEDGNLNEGIFEIGDYQIEIISRSDGINIGILDLITGSSTTVTIPTY
jgi:curli production assembly/transport component CsgF